MRSGESPPVLGRYELGEAIAAGGMATIYVARQAGAGGFSRVVAIKRLHSQYASEPEFIGMFLDEARLAARVRHENVVETVDVVHDGAETFIVLEYVDGESLAGLVRALKDSGERMPLDVASAIVAGACRGLHAAHQARGPDGAPLGLVHRDVSPHNVLVGADGVARVTDFGIALANGRLQHTRTGEVRGKPAYMAPEQLTRDEVTQRSDLYSAGLVLWEVCAGRRAYDARNQGALFARVLTASIPKLGDIAPWVPRGLALVIDRALERDPNLRFASAADMADAITATVAPAPVSSVAAFVERVAASPLAVRRAVVRKLDLGATPLASPALPPPPASGPGVRHAQPAAAPTPRVSTDGLLRHDTRTVTQPGPTPLAAAGPGKTVALLGAALVAAAALGGGGVWLALRSSAAAPSRGGVTDASGAAPATAAVGSSSAAATQATPSAPAETPTAARAPVESTEVAEPSSSVASGNDKMSPSDVRSQTPHARPGASGAASSSQKPCDPPYYLDANGIRRVKRECF